LPGFLLPAGFLKVQVIVNKGFYWLGERFIKNRYLCNVIWIKEVAAKCRL
jgi:hypothetical protein